MKRTILHSLVLLCAIALNSGMTEGCKLPDFPSTIRIECTTYENWSRDVRVSNLYEAHPLDATDVVTIANWAHKYGFRLRPVGARASWSPIVVDPLKDSGTNKLILINTHNLNHMELTQDARGPVVRAGSGAIMNDLLEFLAGKGLGFGSIPATGYITVGGILATSSHGTGVPGAWAHPAGKSFGSLSNMITRLTAVVWNATREEFELKEFSRTNPDIRPLLTCLGRIFIAEVSLRVGKDEKFRCLSLTDITVTTLFAPAGENEAPPNSLTDFVKRSGALTVILYPFTNKAWLRLFTPEETCPVTSRHVTRPYNYVFHDRFPKSVRHLLQTALQGNIALTPLYSKISLAATIAGLRLTRTADIWGNSKNLFLYVSDKSPPVSVASFQVLARRSLLQNVLHLMYSDYARHLDAFAAQGKYPVNAAVEIRIGHVDRTNDVGIEGAQPAVFSISSPILSRPELDTIVWFDISTFSRTLYVSEFLLELHRGFEKVCEGTGSVLRVEWSKIAHFANESESDQWGDQVAISKIPEFYDDWSAAADTVKGMDPHGVFGSSLLRVIIP